MVPNAVESGSTAENWTRLLNDLLLKTKTARDRITEGLWQATAELCHTLGVLGVYWSPLDGSGVGAVQDGFFWNLYERRFYELGLFNPG